MITIDQFISGAMSYYETEICQKASGIGKFTAYFMMPSIPQMIRSRVDQLRGSPFLEGIMNPDGLIELDTLRDRANQAMQHCGSLDVMGFRLNQSDIDILYDKIRRA